MVSGKANKRFCETRRCTFLVLGTVAMAITAVVLTTLFFKGLRNRSEVEHNDLAWWQTGIIYQIYPRSFQDSDGDGIGDLHGIRSRLDYLNYINVGAIWMNPFYKSPMRDFGYDVSDYRQVDPIFGTMNDFDELVKDCHEKNIKVIVDFVPNHTSNESEWFNKSRHAGNSSNVYRDFYVWNPGEMVDGHRQPPNNWQSNFGGSSWTFDPIRGEYYYHNYLSSQPDLNYRHPPVMDEMDKVLRFWLDKGVDGFRIDAITHLFEEVDVSLNIAGEELDKKKYTKNQPEIFGVIGHWKEIVNEYERKDDKQRMLLAESYAVSAEDRMKYYKAGAVPFYFKLIDAKKICQATAQCFLTLIKEEIDQVQGEWPTFVVGSHDNKRISDSIGEHNVDVINMMLLTLPGTPTTYYGEELGMCNGNYTGLPPRDTKAISSGDVTKSRDPERNPMQWDGSLNAGFTSSMKPWLPVTPNTNYTHVNVEVEMADLDSHLSLYKRLAILRQTSAFQKTAIELPEKVQDILIYTRGHSPEKFIVVLNLGENQSSVNVQFSGQRYTKGVVEISTTPGKDGTVVALSDITLQRGEGMVLKIIA